MPAADAPFDKISESFAKMNFDPPEWAQSRKDSEFQVHGTEDELDTDDEEDGGDNLEDADLGLAPVGAGQGPDEDQFTTEKLKVRGI